MKIVLDADLLSTFVRINRLDILNKLFEQIIVTRSVGLELEKAAIKIDGLNSEVPKLTREELIGLGKITDTRLGKGERECLSIAKLRKIPLASNDRLVHLTCKEEGVDYLTLPMLLRLAILKKAVSREEARRLVGLIEREERTVIKNKEEIFK